MEPDLQKFSAFALGGLVLLFPVFNQVALTSIEALTDADHKAQFDDFFKDWDDIPEDEKLSYWDGRNKPPGDGSFDRDKVDDDARIDNAGGQDPDGGDQSDRDGDGVSDEDDADPDDPEVGEGTVRWEEVVLWTCPCDRPQSFDDLSIDNAYELEFVNITFSYDQFSGSATFTLDADGDQIWSDQARPNAGVTNVGSSRSTNDSVRDVGTAALSITYDYQPIGDPNVFQVEVRGAYRIIEEA